MSDNTPVIIGVGEASERIEAPDYRALSPADLAGLAARAALDDALSVEKLAPNVEVIAAIRQFESSAPNAVAPFGRSNNFPRSVARRIGANPVRAILEPVGGQGPQHLVNEFAQSIGAGAMQMALLVGSEAISTVRHLAAKGETRDWAETIDGQLEDRGFGDPLLTRELPHHGARTPISLYALAENARRARLGLDREAYRLEMGRLFAPFTEVAAHNPHAMAPEAHSAEELATVTPRNRLTSDPFPRWMVARDQANQGAAVLMTSIGRARALGVPEDKWIYLHGGADARERHVIERQDLSRSLASIMAAKQAIEVAGLTADEIDLFDLYSCFPIAVFNIRDGLGIAAGDPRPLTMTGGLPYFGGAGNNYSMHGIASMVRALRRKRDAYGFVGANGGFLSKYSVGVYSARQAAWKGFDSKALQAEVDSWPAPALSPPTAGAGVIDTYTIDYAQAPPKGIVIGRLDDGGARFVAMTAPDDQTVLQTMIEREPLGARVILEADGEGHTLIRSIRPVR